MVKPVSRRRDGGEAYKLISMFSDEKGVEPGVAIDGFPVLFLGQIGEIPVIQVPQSSTQADSDRISAAYTDATGECPIIVTSNIRFMRFAKITEEEATKTMKRALEFRNQQEATRVAQSAGNGHLPDVDGAGNAGTDSRAAETPEERAGADDNLDPTAESGLREDAL